MSLQLHAALNLYCKVSSINRANRWPLLWKWLGNIEEMRAFIFKVCAISVIRQCRILLNWGKLVGLIRYLIRQFRRWIKKLLTGLKATVLPHPPYSPDLAPWDFSIFQHLKSCYLVFDKPLAQPPVSASEVKIYILFYIIFKE